MWYSAQYDISFIPVYYWDYICIFCSAVGLHHQVQGSSNTVRPKQRLKESRQAKNIKKEKEEESQLLLEAFTSRSLQHAVVTTCSIPGHILIWDLLALRNFPLWSLRWSLALVLLVCLSYCLPPTVFLGAVNSPFSFSLISWDQVWQGVRFVLLSSSHHGLQPLVDMTSFCSAEPPVQQGQGPSPRGGGASLCTCRMLDPWVSISPWLRFAHHLPN